METFIRFVFMFIWSITYEKIRFSWISSCLSQVARTQTKLICMLENLGMQYDGRPHCGLDDSRNIARIAIHMLKDGCQLRVNECMHSGEPRSVPISAPIEGALAPQMPKKRD